MHGRRYLPHPDEAPGEVGIGYPQIDEFLECSEKQSPGRSRGRPRLPTRLPPMEVEEVDAIARRAHKSAEHVTPILEKLAQKGFLYKDITASGTLGYSFIQIGFGFPVVFLEGEITDEVREISRPLLKYWRKAETA